MKRKQLSHKFLATVLACMCLGPLAVSCVNDDLGCIEDRPGYVEGNDVWFTLSVVNQGSVSKGTPFESPRSVSRADDPMGHPEEEATAAENYINLDDITLMVLDDRRALLRVFNRDEFTVVPITEDYSSYELKFKINRDYFGYASGLDNIPFSIMVIANSKGAKSPSSHPFTWANAGKLVTTLSMSSDNYLEFPDTYNKPWQPDIAGGYHIPMAGISRVSISRVALEGANDDATRLELDPIYMQRAIAKLRVLDGIPSQNDTPELSEITSVGIQGLFKAMALVPYSTKAPAWYTADDTPVIEAGSAPYEEWDYSATIMSYKVENYTATDGKTYKNAFIAYIPEYSASAKVESDQKRPAEPGYIPGQVPLLKIEAKNRFTDEIKPYDIRLTDFPNITDIARNHIYEFTVTALPTAQLNLTLNVKDWDAQETTWDYSDNPAINGEGYLKWLSGTYANIDEANAGLYPRVNYPAVGNFTFSEPQGGEWTAVLIPEGSTELDAFCFVDASGAKVNSISGTIDGSQASISILAQYAPASYDRSARLLFTVHTPDGRTISADVLNGHYGSNKYFTIHQNASL